MTFPVTIRSRMAAALATRTRRIAAALAVATLLVSTGLLVLNRPPGSMIELVAAPAGTISPSGIVHAAPGSTLSFTVTVQRAGLSPVVLNGATTLEPVSQDGATYHYVVTVTGDTAIAASFVQLADDVRLFGPGEGSDIADVSPDETSVSIRAGAPILGRLAVGDILASTPASGRPKPLLVRVVAIDAGADPVRLTTERVALTEAFASASIRVIAPIELGERVPVSATRVGPASAVAKDSISAGVFSFDQSLSHTWAGSRGPASGSITTSGTIKMSASVDMSLETEWMSVKLFETVFREDFSGDATIVATASAEIGDDIELLSRTFSPVCVSIACFVPQVEIGASLTASAHGKITVSAGFAQHARLGVHYENGAWSPVSVNTFTPRGSVDIQASASARFDPTIRVGAKLYGLAGPWIETTPGFLAFGADVHADPWWTLDGGVALSGGVEIDIPFVFNEDYPLASVELARVRLAQASGHAPTPTPSPTATPGPTATSAAVPTSDPPSSSSGGSNEPVGDSIEAVLASIPDERFRYPVTDTGSGQAWSCARDSNETIAWCALVGPLQVIAAAPMGGWPDARSERYATPSEFATIATCDNTWIDPFVADYYLADPEWPRRGSEIPDFPPEECLSSVARPNHIMPPSLAIGVTSQRAIATMVIDTLNRVGWSSCGVGYSDTRIDCTGPLAVESASISAIETDQPGGSKYRLELSFGGQSDTAPVRDFLSRIGVTGSTLEGIMAWVDGGDGSSEEVSGAFGGLDPTFEGVSGAFGALLLIDNSDGAVFGIDFLR